MSEKSNPEFNRLWWHSRRGMLELDVLLLPFLEEAYRSLPEEDQQRYHKLLGCEDTDMFEWFMRFHRRYRRRRRLESENWPPAKVGN